MIMEIEWEQKTHFWNLWPHYYVITFTAFYLCFLNCLFSFLNLYFKIVLMVLIWYLRWQETKDFQVSICFCLLNSVSVKMQSRFPQRGFNVGNWLKDTRGAKEQDYLKYWDNTEVWIIAGSSRPSWTQRTKGGNRKWVSSRRGHLLGDGVSLWEHNRAGPSRAQRWQRLEPTAAATVKSHYMKLTKKNKFAVFQQQHHKAEDKRVGFSRETVA